MRRFFKKGGGKKTSEGRKRSEKKRPSAGLLNRADTGALNRRRRGQVRGTAEEETKSRKMVDWTRKLRWRVLWGSWERQAEGGVRERGSALHSQAWGSIP